MNKIVKITITESETIFVDKNCDIQMSYQIVCHPVDYNSDDKLTEVIIEKDQTNTIIFSKKSNRI